MNLQEPPVTQVVAGRPLIVEGSATQRSPADRWVALVLAAITMAALGVASLATRQANVLRADSPSYLAFDPSRTVGYPAFLALTRLLTGNVALAIPVQMIALGLALFALGWSYYRYSHRASRAIFFQVLLVAGAELWRLSAQMLTEALAAACIAWWCATLLASARKPTSTRTARLVLASAVATMIRPSLVALFIGTAVFVLAMQTAMPRLRSLVMIACGFLFAWGATPIAHYAVSGSATTTSPLARGVLQHSLFCDLRRPPSDSDAAFVERSALPARRFVQAAPASLRPALERTYSGQLRFGLIIPALGARHKLLTAWEVDPLLARIAAERVAANPLCYARSVLAADYRMATYGTSSGALRSTFLKQHPPAVVPTAPLLPGDVHDAVRAGLEIGSEPPLPSAPGFRPDTKNNQLLIILVRTLYSIAAVVGMLALGALLFRRKFRSLPAELIAPASACGAAFHGIIAVTAIVELGLSRYSAGVWPVMCLLVIFGVEGLGHIRDRWLQTPRTRPAR